MTETSATKPRKRAQWQPHLLPIVPPTYEHANIPLRDLAPNSLLRGEPPDVDIIESVRMLGFVDPITVRPVLNGLSVGYGYLVDDGGRRVKAARRIVEELTISGQPIPHYLERVPATVVLDLGDVGAAALALQKHATRRRNKVAEFERVKSLVAAGATEADIHAETRLTKGQIRELMRLDTLLPILLTAAGESRLSWGQAHDIAALPTSAQERLAETFTETGRIKTEDIARERVARREEATARMDWGAIAERPATTGAETAQAPHVAESRAAVDQLLDDAYERRQMDLGDYVLDAIRVIQDGAFRTEAVVEFDGKRYWLRVQEVTELSERPQISDSDATLAEPTPESSDTAAPQEDGMAAVRWAPGASALDYVESLDGVDQAALLTEDEAHARTRPNRIKPCPHGGDPAECQEVACRRRRANTARMRAARGIVA